MNEKQIRLKTISIEGYKSFGQKQEVNLGQINILIGANGVGKSNFLSIFALMANIMNANLQDYVLRQGGADTFFYKGLQVSDKINLKFEFDNKFGYQFTLEPAKPRDVVMTHEDLLKQGKPTPALRSFNSVKAHPESVVANRKIPYAGIMGIGEYLKQSLVYHFADTSDFAKIRGRVYKNDNLALSGDGRNLAAYLYKIKTNYPIYYDRIIQRIGMVMPQFGEFILSSTSVSDQDVNLDWAEKVSRRVFRADQISDGALRYIGLTTLLLQPPEYLPPLLIIDEPELGLHPEAIIDLLGMVKIASQHSQIIIATQSPYLLDCAELGQITVVERDSQGTITKRLKETDFSEWLSEYSVSEIWEKNLLGGCP